jgi:lactoylglutathione lyase
MLKATIIDHLNIDVNDFDETIEFYEKLFGFRLLADQPNKGCRIIGNQYIKLCLYEVPNMEIGPGVNHFGFHVENFEEIMAQCENQNIGILYGGPKVWENSRSIYIEDPNGYEIELSEKQGGGIL